LTSVEAANGLRLPTTPMTAFRHKKSKRARMMRMMIMIRATPPTTPPMIAAVFEELPVHPLVSLVLATQEPKLQVVVAGLHLAAWTGS